MTTQAPCPKCGSSNVGVFPLDGGQHAGATLYVGECSACGYRLENLASNLSGRRLSAVREWNRLVKDPTTAPRADPPQR